MESITTSAIMTVKGAMLSDLSPEIQVCEKCGSEMEEIGKEKVYDALVYTPAKFHVRRHIAKTNKCPNCGDNPEKDAEQPDDIEHCNIRRAAYPKPMIPGSYCSPELLAHIVYEKYGKAVPLQRQEKDFSSKGIPLCLKQQCLTGRALLRSNGVIRFCRR